MKSKYSNFIKLFVSVLIISSALLIQSCSNSETENLSDQISQSTVPQNSVFRVYDKTYNTPEGLQIWEAQLNKTIEMDTNMVRDGLKLIRYEYVRKIASTTDLETVKTELKKDNSLFIVYKKNSSHFSISENKEFAKVYSNLIDSLLPTSTGILEAIRSKGDSSLLAKAAYTFKKNDLGVVNLVWEYNGKTLNTRCLVSDEKGIIYDKFLFSIRTIITKITSVRSNSSKVPQNQPMDGDHLRKNFYIKTTWYDNYGIEIAKAEVSANLYGHWFGGVKFATHFDSSYSSWSILPPWNFDVTLIPINFLATDPEHGYGGAVQFAYGFIWGENVHLNFDGHSMNFTGSNIYGSEAYKVELYAYEMEDYNW